MTFEAAAPQHAAATRPRLVSVGLAAILGAFTPLGYAPFYLFFVPWLTIAGLILLWLRVENAKQAALLGFVFGLGKFCVGVSWVYVSLHDFGGMPAALTGLVTLLFCAILALFPAIAGALVALLRGPVAVKVLLTIPACWALLEWLRGWIFTGFPWLAIGYSQVPQSPLAGFAPFFGVFGTSLAAVVVSGGIAGLALFTLKRRHLFPTPIAVVAIASLLAGSLLKAIHWTQPAGNPVSVSLLQGNIPQEIKWRAETAASTLETYEKLALASNSTLVIFPETALPLLLDEIPERYLARLKDHAKRNGADMLVGVPESTGPQVYHNSVISMGSSPMQIYRKVHLVPFSEFIPFKWLIGWVYDDLLNMPLADFTAGAADQRPMTVAGQKIAITNCYEDLFGEEVIGRLPEATILANVSNDAWFGRSFGPQQHLQISQMRALESGRWMLRATNTGVTAMIDERGRIVSRAPEFTTTSLDRTAQGFAGSTPYVRWGNRAFLITALTMIIVAVALSIRQK